MLESAIELTSVSKEYPGFRALDNISFSVSKNTVHGFLGPNGAGKTTTMRIIAGLLKLNSGTVNLAEGSKIGYLPENPPLYLNMTVKKYLQFVAKINGVKKDDLKVAVNEALETTHLSEVKGRVIGKLSKGYRQRVGIASVLVYRPDIVILDEPTVGLDPSSIDEIRDLIRRLKEKHTVMLSTHQLFEAHKLCDEVTIINHGKIVQSGNLQDMARGFQARQVVSAIVKNWHDSLKREMIESLGVAEVEVNYTEKHIELKIYAGGDSDMRSAVSKYLVDKGCDVLEFKEVTLDLNDIFRLALNLKKGDA